MFAEGFFTLSRQPLPIRWEDMESSTQESDLESIPTWECFIEEEQERGLTDSKFSGPHFRLRTARTKPLYCRTSQTQFAIPY